MVKWRKLKLITGIWMSGATLGVGIRLHTLIHDGTLPIIDYFDVVSLVLMGLILAILVFKELKK